MKAEKKVNDVVVFSPRIAKDLIQKDYKLNNISPDQRNKIKTVFFFQRTEELERYLEDEYSIKPK